MNQKLNHVRHDPRTGTIYISLRPRTERRPVTALEYPGRVILDIDAEGDIYGIRLLEADPDVAGMVFKRLKAAEGGAEGPAGDRGPPRPGEDINLS